MSKTSITFLDTEVYIKNNKLYTKIWRIKKTYRQTFLSINSERPKSLKTKIPYSQALNIKRICSKTTDSEYQLQELKKKTGNQGFNMKYIDQQFSKAKKRDRNKLLKEKQHTKKKFCQSFLPNINNIVRKHYSILSIS